MKITILYVDDEYFNTLVFEESFNQNFDVIVAESGAEGLIKLQNHPAINIVISDMKMPVMDGLQFITAAKKEFPNIPCFLLSGYNITNEIQEALKNKLIVKYFSKPFEVDIIEKEIYDIQEKKS